MHFSRWRAITARPHTYKKKKKKREISLRQRAGTTHSISTLLAPSNLCWFLIVMRATSENFKVKDFTNSRCVLCIRTHVYDKYEKKRKIRAHREKERESFAYIGARARTHTNHVKNSNFKYSLLPSRPFTYSRGVTEREWTALFTHWNFFQRNTRIRPRIHVKKRIDVLRVRERRETIRIGDGSVRRGHRAVEVHSMIENSFYFVVTFRAKFWIYACSNSDLVFYAR